jgi:hypothetical protein
MPTAFTTHRQLLEDPKVLFAGYKMPHPLEHYFVLKVQTTPDTTPAHVLGNALTELIQNVGSMKNKFEVRAMNALVIGQRTHVDGQYIVLIRVLLSRWS